MTPRFAFFDVDDTLIRVKSMFDFYRFWALDWHYDSNMLERFETSFETLRWEGASRETLNRAYYHHFMGFRMSELEEAGAAWAGIHLAKPNEFFFAVSVRRLRDLQALDTQPVFVSGSFWALLAPVAQHLGVQHSLNSCLSMTVDKVLTGEIESPQIIGEGKAIAVRRFLADRNANSSLCFAFGDDLSDLPMLNAVGNPVAVGDRSPLAIHANKLNWEVLTTA